MESGEWEKSLLQLPTPLPIPYSPLPTHLSNILSNFQSAHTQASLSDKKSLF